MQDNQHDRPVLFSRRLLAARRARALRLDSERDGDFLHSEVAKDVADRLAEVTREFTRAIVVSCRAKPYLELLADTVSELDAIACADQGEALRLRPEGADLAVSGLELHTLNDPVGHLIQLRRSLKPDGLLIAALFGGQTLAELRTCLAEAEVEISGGLSPRVAPMGEIRDLGGLLQRAGFAMPVADSRRINVTYASAISLMQDLRCMGETNVLAAQRRSFTARAVLLRAAELYQKNFQTDDGRVTATFEIVFLTGWAPAPDQPVALRPGSASMRLADALETTEQPLPEKAAGSRPEDPDT